MDDDGIPNLGDRRKGRIFVCFGDDKPTDFIDWLQPFVDEFSDLLSLADEYGLPEFGCSRVGDFETLQQLLEAIGVELETSPWTGSLISGLAYFGWIKTGTIREVKSRAKGVLTQARADLEPDVRKRVLEEVALIQPLEAFLEQATTDVKRLQQTIDNLQETLRARNDALRVAEALLPLIPMDGSPRSADESALPKELIGAYQATAYVAEDTPIGSVTLRPGQQSDELESLFETEELAGSGRTAVFITAHNPMSIELPDDRNQARHQSLIHDVRRMGLPYYLGAGHGDDPSWEPEQSLLVLGLSRSEAINLGVLYQQNAIVHCSDNFVPQLLLLR